MEGNVPLELTPEVVPVEEIQEELTETLNIDELLFSIDLEDHPKLRSLSFEVDILEVEKRLRANKLLPKLDLEYNFLTSNPEDLNTINNRNYKMGVKFSFPLFLRKERGELQLSKLALENAELDLVNARLKLKNDLKSLQNQIIALKEQNSLMNQLVRDYTSMVSAEERKFELGESSLFLINSRENKLISARLKEIEMNFKLLKSKAELFKTLAEIVKF
ncbi:TolC family protein [Christiangramia echinicola]|uniref:TolC family protein n=1 Tax=Christiangramia echinicola TaxID=279359 RepID=UPI0004233DE4|nr:TolC family protein [Christiangramia echinicola]